MCFMHWLHEHNYDHHLVRERRRIPGKLVLRAIKFVRAQNDKYWEQLLLMYAPTRPVRALQHPMQHMIPDPLRGLTCSSSTRVCYQSYWWRLHAKACEQECLPVHTRKEVLSIRRANLEFLRRLLAQELFFEDYEQENPHLATLNQKQQNILDIACVSLTSRLVAWEAEQCDCPEYSFWWTTRYWESTLIRALVEQGTKTMLLFPTGAFAEAYRLSKVPCAIDTHDGGTMYHSPTADALCENILEYRVCFWWVFKFTQRAIEPFALSVEPLWTMACNCVCGRRITAPTIKWWWITSRII